MLRVARAARFSSGGVRRLSSLIIGEHDGTKLSESTLAAVTACATLGPTTVLIGGSSCKADPQHSRTSNL